MNETSLCWINGTIKPARDVSISIFDHGLLYGDGVFEGLRFYHGKTFMLEAHLKRLQTSADGIALELPCSLEQIAEAIDALITAYAGDSGYLRLVVTRGAGSLGIDPRKCARPNLFIIADEVTVMDVTDPAHGVSLHVARTPRTPAQCLDPKVKSLNYLNNILARIEANRAGCDEALMLNLDGNVCEGSVDNVFIVAGGVLKTPPLTDGMLEGITRAVVIDVAAKAGIACEQISLRVSDLQRADECFLTGTGAELIPVRTIDGQLLPVTRTPLLPVIMQGFRDSIAEYCTRR
jgi:branched-chain amino acid aminotransferase